jgi:hypothetical protein
MCDRRQLRPALCLAALAGLAGVVPAGAGPVTSLDAEVSAGNFRRPIHIGPYHVVPEPLPVPDGVYEVTLLVRTEPAGGELLWEKSYAKLPIRDGRIHIGFVEPPDGVRIAGSWLEILVDRRLAGGPTEIAATATVPSLGISESGMDFVAFDQFQNPGAAGLHYLVDETQDGSYFDFALVNADGPIILDGRDWVEINASAWLASYAVLLGRAYLQADSNATLDDGTGYLVIGHESGQNLVFDNNEIQARNNGNAATLFLQHQGGDIWFQGSPIHTSDRRKKRDIHDLDLGLEEVLQLRPVSFEWKDLPGPRRPGLVAQEVRDVLADLVTEDEEGTLGLAYSSLIPVLLRAIQEQQAEIEQLREDLTALRSQLRP